MINRDEAAARVRNLGADVVELIRVRVELFALEARADAGLWLQSLLLGMLAVLLLAFGLAFVAFWVTAALWDTQRMIALGGFTVFFLLGGVLLALWVRTRMRRGLRAFRSTLDELARDRDSLRP